VGELTLGLLRGGPELARFLVEVQGSLLRAARGRARYRRADFWLTVQQVGPDALPIVSLISFLVGVILAYMGALQLVQFGAEIYIADLVAIGMVRELGALMTGIILAGRSGAAFAAQIGTMQVNEEVDALRTLGIAPIEYLVLPRLLALIVMMPLLTIYAGLAGMLAGLFISTTVMGIDGFEYVQQSLRALSLEHLLVGLSKGTVYGVLIALAGCLRGMQCGRSAQAVGEATTSAVVTSILWIVISASFLTVLYQHLGI
jgi:phospholipid/cholesterol/gamma-HCH transport system permease protein